MAATTRSSAKKAAAKAAPADKAKQPEQASAADEDDAPLPFGSRIVIIILTSYVAEKIWRYRSVVTDGWYSDSQSAIEQAMITGFEYTVLMGLLFFLGILISVVTVSIQKKITG